MLESFDADTAMEYFLTMPRQCSGYRLEYSQVAHQSLMHPTLYRQVSLSFIEERLAER
jgi:hypothetical protein